MKLTTCSLAFAIVLLAGCASTLQTTSGKDYLDKYASVPLGTSPAIGGDSFDIDAAVRQAAAVEPVLEFPARIGLVRINGGSGISDIPALEAEHWAELVESLGDGFGQFVPINPLVAQLVAPAVHHWQDGRMNVISQVRLAAARQHLDAVLMYEVNTSREIEKNAFAATDFSLITAFVLPSRKVKGQAVGTAVLIDVIQGYPYATMEARVEENKLSTAWNASSKGKEIAARLRAEVAAELASEAKEMFTELRSQLAEQRVERYRQREEQSATSGCGRIAAESGSAEQAALSTHRAGCL